MHLVQLILRAGKASPERRRLLVESLLRLVQASSAVRLLPFKRAIRLGAVPLKGAEPGRSREGVRQCVGAIETAARVLPMRTLCIQKGIALQRMLRGRNVDARLHYGIGTGVDDELRAHVWVVVGGEAVMGGAEAAQFTCVAVYPEGQARA